MLLYAQGKKNREDDFFVFLLNIHYIDSISSTTVFITKKNWNFSMDPNGNFLILIAHYLLIE